MADYVDGTIVRPGETFSFNERVGPRTAERGFLEGQMIVGSLLLPSIGGGVCQTATTLFNAATRRSPGEAPTSCFATTWSTRS
jgi:vancomycin resistance protein YoaR